MTGHDVIQKIRNAFPYDEAVAPLHQELDRLQEEIFAEEDRQRVAHWARARAALMVQIQR